MQRRWKLSVGPAGRYVEPLEGGTVVTCDWSSARQGPCRSFTFCWRVTEGSLRPLRRRSRRVLTLAEREDISRGIASGCSMRVIAQRLSRACSTVSREVARHGGRAQYRANEADQQAWESALRPKPCLLATHSKLQEIVASKLMQDWSPEQISGWLKTAVPGTTRACACRTKRFIAACSFKRAER